MPVPFKLPRFYPILDTTVLAANGCALLDTAEGLFDAGIRMLQYRHKDAWTQAHFDEAKKLTQRCQDLGVLFVLNDRADYARLLRTALHIGQDDLPPKEARSIIGDEILGFSTHNEAQLLGVTESASSICRSDLSSQPSPNVTLIRKWVWKS